MYYLLFLFIIYGGMIDFRIGFLNYWDEITVLIVLLLWLKKGILKSVKKDKNTLRLYLILISLIGIGIISNVIHAGIQSSYVAIIKDVFAFLKFPIVMLLMPGICNLTPSKISKLCKLCKTLVCITMTVAIIGYIFDIGAYVYEPGRMLKTFEFYYRHTTFFVSSYVCILVVFIQDSIKNNKMYILLTCLLLFLSQRTKAFFIIAIILGILIIGENRIKKLYFEVANKLRFKKKYIYIVLIVGILAAWMLGKDKVAYYFSYGVGAARPALYIVGIRIMIDYFPFGSGWGTFASYISGEYYSGLYDRYEISNVNGLTRENYAYVGDVFWPYIYAQLGMIGLFAYIFLMFKLFMKQLVNLKKYDTIIAFVVLWLYALFASSAEAYFINPTGVRMAIMLKLFIKNETVNSERFR